MISPLCVGPPRAHLKAVDPARGDGIAHEAPPEHAPHNAKRAQESKYLHDDRIEGNFELSSLPDFLDVDVLMDAFGDDDVRRPAESVAVGGQLDLRLLGRFRSNRGHVFGIAGQSLGREGGLASGEPEKLDAEQARDQARRRQTNEECVVCVHRVDPQLLAQR